MPLSKHPGCNPACRACHYKDLEYPEQLERKRRWASSQLAPWSGVLRDIVAAPEAERLEYRSKSWMRSGLDANGELSFGMLRSVFVDGSWEQELVSWNDCPLHATAIRRMIGKLRPALARGMSELAGIWFGRPHLVVVSRGDDLERVRALDWSGILEAPFERAWFHRNPQVGRKVFSHLPIEPVHAAPGAAAVPAGAAHPIRAFRQVAQTLLAEARRLAVAALVRGAPATVLDLYCGTGDLSLLLPPAMGWIGIEMSRDAVAFANTLRAGGVAPHAAFAGAVEQRLRDPNVLGRIGDDYSIYVNPPRPGLTEEARALLTERLRSKPPRSIVYLSCSASSLARDLAALEAAGFGVESLRPFDFFSQTEHFETLAVLGRVPVT